MTLAEILVLGSIILTAGGLIAYRLLKGKQIIFGSGVPLITPAAPLAIDARTVIMILVSVLVLGSSLYVILSMRYDAASQKWAFGVIGTILGFWLRAGK